MAARSLGGGLAVRAMAGPIDVAIVDLVLDGGSGLKLIDELRGQRPEVQLLLYTAMPDTRTVADAVNLGARTVVDKPATVDELRARAAGARVILRNCPQMLAHTLYKAGLLRRGDIVLESVREEEPYG